MSAVPLVGVKFTALYLGGAVANGSIATYVAGTLTGQATYTSPTISSGTTNANPVQLDASGQADIYLNPALTYRFRILDSLGALVDDVDNWGGGAVDASLIAYTQTAGISRSVSERISERISVLDWMTAAERAAFYGRTKAVDHTPAFNLAVGQAKALGGRVKLEIPAGLLRLTSPITQDGALVLEGVGQIGQGTTGDATANQGSMIFFDHVGKGFVVTGSGFTARGIAVARPQTTPALGWTPYASDFDFDLTSTDTTLDDVLFYGSAKGVRLNAGGRLLVNEVRGQVFNKGIVIEVATDSVRITGAHFWPFWSMHDAVRDYQNLNLTTLTTKRCDGLFLSDLFSIWQKRTWSVEHNVSGDSINVKAANIYSDAGGDGFVVETGTNGVTAQITNFNHQGSATTTGCGVSLKGTNAQVDIFGFKSDLSYLNAIRNADGTENKLRVFGLYMTQWNAGAGGFGGLELSGTGNEACISTMASIGTPASGTTNAFSGSNRRQGVWKRVQVSGTTGAAGLISFAHGLGYTPGDADIHLNGSNGHRANVITVDSTNVNCVVYLGSATLNSAAVAGSMNLYY